MIRLSSSNAASKQAIIRMASYLLERLPKTLCPNHEHDWQTHLQVKKKENTKEHAIKDTKNTTLTSIDKKHLPKSWFQYQ